MNDADWMRKHLRGKVQRTAAETESTGLKARMRRFVARVLRRVRPDEPADEPSSGGPVDDGR
ncbi:MAG: hypothetical protein GY913_31475 [Proteobacteria bacterium]|nr:hypothetical protein [Pseudomonadota bacterium]MCP4921441.1 hypothetical protein [Pseudomonadota bacterium]